MNEAPNREVTVFNEALLLPARQRADYLDEACAGDAGLRLRVEALLQAHQQAGAFLQEPTPAARRSLDAAAPEEPSAAARVPANLAEKPGDRIGRYKLLQQIGEGGCGIVYMAEQEDPVRRRVALKVIKLGMDTKSVIARFEAERQALALMDHPNIAKVFDAGATETGRPFFVMELVRGTRISDYCDKNSLSTPERLDLFIQVCLAIQHAHQKGVIHRDIKPSNILVTVNDGVPVPKVIDFGIAKATQGRLTDQTLFTAFEQFIGTPAYMSPEQSILTSVDVDTRSDIYSLGVLLYELLTGQTPFKQEELLSGGLEEMRRTIQEKEPVRPSTRLSTMVDAELTKVARQRQSEPPKLIHLVRGDLDWIVMKCLEKDRARRYETANGLAMDVQRFLACEPIIARPPSKLYRIRKLARRNKFVVAAVGAVALALVIGLGLSTWQFIEKSKAEREQSRLREAAQIAQANEAQSRHRAEAQELAARKKAYASDMNLLQQAVASDDLGRAQELLDRQRPQPGEEDLRGWEWRYFWQFCQSDAAFTLCRRSNSIVSVSFSSDGALLAVGTYFGEVTVWDMAGRQPIFRWADGDEGSGRLAFAPRGELLAFSVRSNGQARVVLWDRRNRGEIRTLPVSSEVRELAFSRAGQLFTVELNRSNNVNVWDPATGTTMRQFTAKVADYGMGTVFNITDDGGRFTVALGQGSHSARVADLDGSEDFTLRVAEELTTALLFARDGQTLITGAGYAEGTIKLWDLRRRQLSGSLEGHRSWVGCLRFLPDGKTLASASADRTIRLWDLESRRPLRTLRGHGGEMWTIDVTPDSRWLASGCKDGSVILWDLTSSTNRPPPFRTITVAQTGSWSYSPDGRLLGTIQTEEPHNHLRFYDAATAEPMSDPAPPWTNLVTHAFSSDMRLLVATDAKGQLLVWDVPGRRMITNFMAHSGLAWVNHNVFLAGDSSMLTLGDEHVVKEWDTATWKELGHWPVDGNLAYIAISPRADLVATATKAGAFELIKMHNPQMRRRFTGQDRVIRIALSPDGRTLAAASENGTVELWDTESITRTALLRGVLLGYHSVTISPDGRRLAAGSNGQEAMKIWDLQSREEVATLHGNGSFFGNAAFSPDGNSILARNWSGVIHVWTAPSWELIEASEKTRRSSTQ